MSTLTLNEQSVQSLHGTAYARDGRVQIREVLTSDSANWTFELLSTFREWNLAFTVGGQHKEVGLRAFERWPAAKRRKLTRLIHADALIGFQYLYAAAPIYEIFHGQLLPGHGFNAVYEFLNSPALLSFVAKVTGRSDIGFADCRATRFDANHFLTGHDDAVEGKRRRVAYVLNLTPVWRVDWGGILQFIDADGNVAAGYTPSFNTLNLFRVPSVHSVSSVAAFAAASRYSITGWFRAGDDPGPTR